jgi:hypothetical protein
VQLNRVFELKDSNCRSMSQSGLSNYSITGGPLSQPTHYGVQIHDSKGFTLAISPDTDWAKLSVLSPLMALCLLDLLYHADRGDELKDHMGDVGNIVKMCFDEPIKELLKRFGEIHD